ncbi:MAG TPA: molybdenum cofactor guanylyltransferase MobA [Gammaproteobacteria bacterium]|nr:molybdenum cofactor guanylyltransferase MobA [Gammaproteobacteria bacterium]
MAQYLPTRPPITAIVLAGGRATRMGGIDKGLVELGGRPMIAHVLAVLAPQVERVLINANRNLDRYAEFGWPVVPDEDTGFLGPLAGLAAGLRAAVTPLVLTAPCDCPLLAPDLAARLYSALDAERAEIAVPFDGERLQPVFALVRRELGDSLAAYLGGGERKIDRWFAQHRLARVDFSDRPETFVNVNDPDERAALELRLAADSRAH